MRTACVRTISLIAILIALYVVPGVTSVVHPQPQPAFEYELKAGFLYNFAKFVEWPPETFAMANDALVLCVLGKNTASVVLTRVLQGKAVKGKKLVIRPTTELTTLRSCHIVFISGVEENRLAQVWEALQGAQVLTVGEMERFARQGGIINFIQVQNKIRFEINLNAAKRAGLKLSSQLLKLAILVEDKGYNVPFSR